MARLELGELLLVFATEPGEFCVRGAGVSRQAYTQIGAWWDRRGENEIDLVCENEFSQQLDFYEVKRDSSRFVTALLGRKVEAFLAKNPSLKSMKITSGVLSMEDM